MNKNLIVYITSSILLTVVLAFFFSSYRTMDNYSAQLHRHHTVHTGFQDLSTQIHNAAVLHPGMMRRNENSPLQFFLADSMTIMSTLHAVRTAARDSVNIACLAELDILLKREIGWIISSNVPDSILLHRSNPHLQDLVHIDSLIKRGIARTDHLITLRDKNVNKEIKKVTILLIAFVIMAVVLLVYTTVGQIKQHSKRRSKEHELAMTLNRMNDGVISLDTNWRYTFLNEAAMAQHSGDRDSLIGKTIWEVYPQMDATPFGKKCREVMQTGQPAHIEDYYAPLNSWFSARLYPSASGLTIFYRDISAAREAMHHLAKTRKEIEDYKFALDEANIVAITDQKGIITHVNDNFCKISKYTAEELIGKDHRLINSGYHSKTFIRDLWVTIANGRIWKGEMCNKAKDGSIYWVDTTIVPFLNEQGKPYQYVAIRADITQRKATEEKLKKSERIYKTIASGIPGSVICLLDRELRYFLIEGDLLQKLGYSKEQLLGNKAEEVLPPALFNELKVEFESAIQGHTSRTEALRNGYDVITRFIPLKDETGYVYAIMTVSIDVTQLKNAERNITAMNRNLETKIELRTEELRRSNEELESFSYSVSHDLRAPLRGITGFAAVLAEEYGKDMDEEANRIIQVIRDSAAKMGQLIDDLLAFSRTGKQPLQKISMNSHLTVEAVKEDINKHIANGKAITWQIDELPRVDADPATFQQVWTNLLSNAVKYSSTVSHPRIHVGARIDPGQVVFFVKDNGVGFDEKYQHKLFKVFQRLHDTDEFEGTGVGLALVERIISKHGGKIWAEGKVGEGACFSFSLPA